MTWSARAARAVLSGLALVVALSPAAAQDSAVARPPLLGADTSRIVPFQREYDMLAWVADSVVPIGVRTVRMDSTVHAGVPAWVIVETRTGAVPAAESLFVSRDLRPLQWSSAVGVARLTAAFGRDSMFGGTTGPAGRQTIILGGGPFLVSTAMTEALFPLLQWSADRSDSVRVLEIDHVSTSVIAAELAVIGEDSVATPAAIGGGDSIASPRRPAWIVALRAPARTVLFWVDRETGTLLRLQQPLPLNGASMLEYRLRSTAVPGPGAVPPSIGR